MTLESDFFDYWKELSWFYPIDLAIDSQAKSISSIVVNRPSENRIDEYAASGVKPIASSTCEGSGKAEEDALPGRKAISFFQRVINSSERNPGKERLLVFGKTFLEVAFATALQFSTRNCSSRVR